MLHILYYIAFLFNHALQQTSLNLLNIYNACTVGASAWRIHFFLVFALVSVQVFWFSFTLFVSLPKVSLMHFKIFFYRNLQNPLVISIEFLFNSKWLSNDVTLT